MQLQKTIEDISREIPKLRKKMMDFDEPFLRLSVTLLSIQNMVDSAKSADDIIRARNMVMGVIGKISQIRDSSGSLLQSIAYKILENIREKEKMFEQK